MSCDVERAGVNPNTAIVDAEIAGVDAAAETAGVIVGNEEASDYVNSFENAEATDYAAENSSVSAEYESKANDFPASAADEPIDYESEANEEFTMDNQPVSSMRKT